MAKLFNLTYANQMFGEAFTSTFLQTQKLLQQESQFSRDLNFQNRQLQLGEAFRRDELAETAKYHNIYGNYLNEQIEQGKEEAKMKMDAGRVNMLGLEFTQVDETMSPAPSDVKTYEAYGKNWMFTPKPEEQARWESDKFGNQVEAKGYYNDAGEWTTTNYETVVSPPTDGSAGVDISNEVGELHKLIEFYDMNAGKFKAGDELTYTDSEGNELKMDYKLLKSNMTKHMTDMMSKAKVPLQGDLVTNIRDMAGIIPSDDNATKRKKLLHTVDYARSQGALSESQYEVLRYWAEAGTR